LSPLIAYNVSIRPPSAYNVAAPPSGG